MAGITRDRTNLFISYRQSYAHHPAGRARYSDFAGGALSNGRAGKQHHAGGGGGDGEEERMGLMSEAGDAVIEMGALPPRWADVADEVAGALEEVQRRMARLEPMLAKHVLPGFEDDAVKRREEREIERATQDITRGFQGCQRAIKRIDGMVREARARPGGAGAGGLSRADETMARNLQISLASRVGDVSAVFRKKQSVYLKKLRALNGMATTDRANTPQTLGSNPYTDPSLVESMEDRSFSQSTLQQTAQKRRSSLEPAIAQREKEIEDIAQGIIELANIFQELQTMVIDQGTMLDRIDYNVERMATDVQAADKELTVATSYQKRSTKRRIILLLVLIVAGLIILLIVKPKRSRQPAVEPAPAPGDDGAAGVANPGGDAMDLFPP